ncbi:MAG: hypothetical protein ACRDYC_07115, partial [Acidimicrobiales bacterium]
MTVLGSVRALARGMGSGPVAVLLALGLTAPPASAQPTSASTTSSDASQIYSLTQSFNQDLVEADSLEGQLRSDATQLATVQAKVTATRSAVTEEAVSAYTGGVPTAGSLGQLSAATSLVVLEEYLNVASGDLDTFVVVYQNQEQQLEYSQRLTNQALTSTRQALNSASTARSEAINAAEAEQARLDAQAVSAANQATDPPAAPVTVDPPSGSSSSPTTADP